ncbi:MAG: zinc ribbon domain-containing protein [Chloroflexota bacterium]
MQTRIFHGKLSPADFARALIAEFDRGELRAQGLGDEDELMVQIVTRDYPRSGGPTALTISLRAVEDGVAVQIGKQNWVGVAASLGQTALRAWRNPFSLIDRLDDLAQDINNLQLSERVWDVIESTATTLGASFELSERLRRLVCEYCHAANPVGEATCLACGAPLGKVQPRTCPNCGFVVRQLEAVCPNCKHAL